MLSVLKVGGSVLRDEASYAATAEFLRCRLGECGDEQLVVIVSAMIAAFSGARQFRRVPGWGALARYSGWTGVIGATVWVLTFIALNPASPIADAGIGGLLNRVLAVVAFGWYTVTGWWLLRRPRVSNVDVQSR